MLRPWALFDPRAIVGASHLPAPRRPGLASGTDHRRRGGPPLRARRCCRVRGQRGAVAGIGLTLACCPSRRCLAGLLTWIGWNLRPPCRLVFVFLWGAGGAAAVLGWPAPSRQASDHHADAASRRLRHRVRRGDHRVAVRRRPSRRPSSCGCFCGGPQEIDAPTTGLIREHGPASASR